MGYVQPPLPRYSDGSVTVEALLIFDVSRYPDGGAILQPHLGQYSPIDVHKAWVDQWIPEPEPGMEQRGYWVHWILSDTTGWMDEDKFNAKFSKLQ